MRDPRPQTVIGGEVRSITYRRGTRGGVLHELLATILVRGGERLTPDEGPCCVVVLHASSYAVRRRPPPGWPRPTLLELLPEGGLPCLTRCWVFHACGHSNAPVLNRGEDGGAGGCCGVGTDDATRASVRGRSSGGHRCVRCQVSAELLDVDGRGLLGDDFRVVGGAHDGVDDAVDAGGGPELGVWAGDEPTGGSRRRRPSWMRPRSCPGRTMPPTPGPRVWC